MGLSKLAIEKPFFRIPEGVNEQVVDQCLINTRNTLDKKYGNDLDAKIRSLEKVKADFVSGKLKGSKMYHTENWCALNQLLCLLKIQKIKLPRRA